MACSCLLSTVQLSFIFRFCVALMTYPFGYNRTCFSTTSIVLVSSSKVQTYMECAERLRRHYILAVLQHDCIQTEIALHAYIQARRRSRGQCNRTCWIQRRREYGLYDHLMVELRREDQTEFINFMRMPPEMFNELLERVGPRISKERTWSREPIEPGVKLAITLSYLASGSKYPYLKFGWRVPASTQSLLVREVSLHCINVI